MSGYKVCKTNTFHQENPQIPSPSSDFTRSKMIRQKNADAA